MESVRKYVRKNRDEELSVTLQNKVENLEAQGYTVEFGKIGVRTTYAFLHDEVTDEEIVGYTYIKNKQYLNETVGKIKALDQALARKEAMSNYNR